MNDLDKGVQLIFLLKRITYHFYGSNVGTIHHWQTIINNNMIESKKLVFFDTNVIIAILRSRRGASFQLLKWVIEGDPRLQILLSVPLFLEYEAVLKREEQLAANHLQVQDIDTILDMLAARAKKIKIPMVPSIE